MDGRTSPMATLTAVPPEPAGYGGSAGEGTPANSFVALSGADGPSFVTLTRFLADAAHGQSIV